MKANSVSQQCMGEICKQLHCLGNWERCQIWAVWMEPESCSLCSVESNLFIRKTNKQKVKSVSQFMVVQMILNKPRNLWSSARQCHSAQGQWPIEDTVKEPERIFFFYFTFFTFYFKKVKLRWSNGIIYVKLHISYNHHFQSVKLTFCMLYFYSYVLLLFQYRSRVQTLIPVPLNMLAIILLFSPQT